jgi:hypothetical protein
MRKILSAFMLAAFFFGTQTPFVFAEGLREGAASLLLPTTGQAMNGELGNTKTKIMAGVEVASVTAITVIGIATGGAAVWFGAAPLIANHLWSATDAYKGAKSQEEPYAGDQQILEAQRTLELSRQQRYARQEAGRYDIRTRIQQAGEAAQK